MNFTVTISDYPYSGGICLSSDIDVKPTNYQDNKFTFILLHLHFYTEDF